MTITAADFVRRWGPMQPGDLHRVNCEQPGDVGHWTCGICEAHGLPYVMCSPCTRVRLEAAGKL